MSRPLFEVGEEVIAVATERAVAPFDAVVTDVLTHPFNGSFGYRITPDFDSTDSRPWAESALRKKHKPGDSFDTLMTNLKNPQRVEA